MELRNVKTFLTAANTGSFSQAAEELGYAQSTITAQIRQLENELGIPLFDRYGKRIRLSNAGHSFLPYAYELAKCESAAISHFCENAAPQGELRIGMIESVNFSSHQSAVLDYMKQYPQVQIRITVATTLEILGLLKQGKLDVILTLDSRVPDSDIVICHEQEEPIHFICACGSPWAVGSIPSSAGPNADLIPSESAIRPGAAELADASDSAKLPAEPRLADPTKEPSLADLAAEPWILAESGRNYIREFEAAMAARSLCPRVVLEAGSTSMIINAVQDGIGISLLPEFCLMKAEGVDRIRLRDYELTLLFQVIYNKNRWLSSAARAFIELFE